MLLSQKKTEYINFADKLMVGAYQGRLEESEIKKIVLNFRKMGSNEKAIEFIGRIMEKYPHQIDNPTLLDMRARATMDLAKICMDTGRNRDVTTVIKAKAWGQCRSYLSSAENDLNHALRYVTSPWEREFIVESFSFLRRMKSFAAKPPRRHQR